MHFSTALTVAFAAMAGVTTALSHGMLSSCDTFSITELDGDGERSMTLRATCTGSDGKSRHFTSIDLNKCFGWDSTACGFTFGSSGFTKYTAKCSNTKADEAHFGDSFGCYGPWYGHSNCFQQISLDAHIGNSNGRLVC